jgi:hypothetical protein
MDSAAGQRREGVLNGFRVVDVIEGGSEGLGKPEGFVELRIGSSPALPASRPAGGTMARACRRIRGIAARRTVYSSAISARRQSAERLTQFASLRGYQIP